MKILLVVGSGKGGRRGHEWNQWGGFDFIWHEYYATLQSAFDFWGCFLTLSECTKLFFFSLIAIDSFDVKASFTSRRSWDREPLTSAGLMSRLGWRLAPSLDGHFHSTQAASPANEIPFRQNSFTTSNLAVITNIYILWWINSTSHRRYEHTKPEMFSRNILS